MIFRIGIMVFTIITFLPSMVFLSLNDSTEDMPELDIEKQHSPPKFSNLLYRKPYYMKYEITALKRCDTQFRSRGGFAILVWKGTTKAEIIRDKIDTVSSSSERHILLWELVPFFDGTIDTTNRDAIQKFVVDEHKSCRAIVDKRAAQRNYPEYKT